MNAVTRLLLRWRGLPLMTGMVAAIVLVMFLGRAATGDEGSTDWLLLVLWALTGVLLVFVALRVLVMLSGVDPDAASIAQRLTAEPDQRRLLARWLRRTRWARNVGGIAGITWWIFGTFGQGDALLFGVGGIALGSMAAQLHHVRKPVGPRTASLGRRSVVDYIPSEWQRRMIAVSGLAVSLIIGGIVVADAGSAIWWGLGSLTALCATHLVQRRVAERPRPALSTGLQRADDLARGLAIDRGLAQPATYFSLALFGHGAGSFEPAIGGIAVAVSIGAWLYTFYLWWHNRRLGLDHLMEADHAAAVAV